MTQAIDMGSDDGIVPVKLPDGGEMTIDALDAFEQWRNWCKEHEKSDRFDSTLPAFVETLGLPKCSTLQAVRFVNGLSDVVEGLKKNAGSGPSSPASTADSGPDLETPTDPSANVT